MQPFYVPFLTPRPCAMLAHNSEGCETVASPTFSSTRSKPDTMFPKVLIIDDSTPIRTFLKVTLGIQGYTLIEAGTAREGITLWKHHQPDLVILDLGLPDMDGLEVLDAIRTESRVPVIILTVRNESEYHIKAKQKGANAYLTKPFQIDELVEQAAQLLQK